MSGINQLVKVTLRNPLDYDDRITYTIVPDDHLLARDWISALKGLLKSGNLLEKNFCFLGFPKSARTLEYLCDQLNQAVEQINKFNATNVWVDADLDPYIIEDWYCPDSVRFSNTYTTIGGQTDSTYVGEFANYYQELGLSLKHGMMNRLHNYFEQLQGTVWNLSPYYKLADYETKYAIRQLNNICHEMENLVLSYRKLITSPEWIRPSQITTFLNAQRHKLKDQHRELFVANGYDRGFGHVYMHWTQIGKTLFEVFRDEDAPKLTDTVCEAINGLQYYSGEFDVEWAASIYYNNQGKFPWHIEEQDRFRSWLIDNNLDPQDPKLSLGYLPVGKIDLQGSFGTTDQQKIWDILSRYLDIYSIEVDGIINTFNYGWNDPDYKQQQIAIMRPGYDFSSRG
jgi:hypothetical protein